MTLTQLLRPVQKGVGRLLFTAGTNSAVPTQNSMVDQVVFSRDGEATTGQQMASANDAQQMINNIAAGATSSNQQNPVQMVQNQQPQMQQQQQMQQQPQAMVQQGGAPAAVFAFPCGNGQAWQFMRVPQPFANTPGASSSSNGPMPGPVRWAAVEGVPPGSTVAWQSGRWAYGPVMYPVLMHPFANMQQSSSAAAEADAAPAEQEASTKQRSALPGRTGASRRQRRRQQQLAQQQSLEKGTAASTVTTTLDAEWENSSQELQQASTGSSQLSRSSSMLSLSKLGEGGVSEETDCSSSKLSIEELSGDSSSSDMVLFPPTPEHSPCASPRYFNAPQPSFWLEQPVQFVLPMEADASSYGNFVSQHQQQEPQNNSKNQSSAQQEQLPASPEVTSPPPAQCENALKALDSSDEAERREAMEWVSQEAWLLARSPVGCRVVQRALDVAVGGEDQLLIAQSLHGCVREAVASPHANHVLQKCVEILPPENLQFVLDELKGHVIVTARHRFGCRVLERLIEHCPTWQTESLMTEILDGASQLSRHTFGNFVIQHVLEHGTQPQRRVIVDMLLSDIQRLARHRVASHVVRAALVHCNMEDRQELVDAMRADAAELADLAHHHCGSFVVREMRRELRR